MQSSMREKPQRGFILNWKFTDMLFFAFESESELAVNFQAEISPLILVVGQIGLFFGMSSSGT